MWLYNGKEYTTKKILEIAKTSKTRFYNLIRNGWTIPQIINNKPIHHGMHDTRLYGIYYAMIKRCYNPTNENNKKNYHDKGITVCGEWLEDNKAFFDWALSHGYADNLTIDRIDNNKGYSPDNCRWITMFEQNQNRSDTIKIKYNNEIHSIVEWIDKLNLNLSRRTIRDRIIRNGWNVEEAFFTPKYDHRGKEKNVENKLRTWLAKNGIYALGVLKQNKTIDDIGYHQKVFNGGYMCTAGVPDLSITIHGIDIRIECKQETGLLSMQQKHILKQILDSGGGFILKPSNYDDVTCFLNAIIEHDDITRNAMYQVLASQTYCLINERDRK